MPGMSGLDLTKQIHKQYPDLPVIIMTAYSDMDSAMSAYDSGAFEYLPKPFDINEAVELARRACASSKTLQSLDDHHQDSIKYEKNGEKSNVTKLHQNTTSDLPIAQQDLVKPVFLF